MKKIIPYPLPVFFLSLLLAATACHEKNSAPSIDAIKAIQLKRGAVVLCGPPDKELGTVSFETSCPGKEKKDMDMAIALLHSFEYDEAEKVFAKIIDAQPGCAIAYWGVAMCSVHFLWTPPSQPELEKGTKAITIAQAITQKTARESAYIEAMALFYKDWHTTDHLTRCIRFEKAMEKIYIDYPEDKEAAIFYALALDGAADPADKSYLKQKKAGAILTALYPEQPYHPGIIHYIIHSYDYPELAALALPAARKYAAIAPASAHAQHMPSHIFTRLGLWDDCIQSNLVSVAAAKCYAENTGIKGHWDEELHGMDYLLYAYLQKADNTLAKEQLDYLKIIRNVYPANFKVAYAFAAIPARYYVENKMWKEAAALETLSANFSWQQFPWQKAITNFARLLGAVHTGKPDAAAAELNNLHIIYDTLMRQKDVYKAGQVAIQLKMGEAWIQFKKGKNNDALNLMNTAASMEDKTQKHPVTPGEIIPAKELLADMLAEMGNSAKALEAYEADLQKHPSRFNGLYGAALASEGCHNMEKASHYYQQLASVANSTHSSRPELDAARLFLKNHTAVTNR